MRALLMGPQELSRYSGASCTTIIGWLKKGGCSRAPQWTRPNRLLASGPASLVPTDPANTWRKCDDFQLIGRNVHHECPR